MERCRKLAWDTEEIGQFLKDVDSQREGIEQSLKDRKYSEVLVSFLLKKIIAYPSSDPGRDAIIIN